VKEVSKSMSAEFTDIFGILCSVLSALPTIWIVILFITIPSYRTDKKACTLANFVVCNCIAQYCRLPNVLRKLDFISWPCDDVAIAYLFAVLHLPLAYAAVQLDVLIELICPYFYKASVRLLHIVAALFTIHGSGICLVVACIPAVVELLHYSSNEFCPVEWTMASPILAAYLYFGVYVACGLLGLAQITAACIGTIAGS
jgi:hypothetical protein